MIHSHSFTIFYSFRIGRRIFGVFVFRSFFSFTFSQIFLGFIDYFSQFFFGQLELKNKPQMGFFLTYNRISKKQGRHTCRTYRIVARHTCWFPRVCRVGCTMYGLSSGLATRSPARSPVDDRSTGIKTNILEPSRCIS